MLTIDATVGGTASNSFGTLAEAEEYFAARLPAQKPNWLATGDDDEAKKAALISATDRLQLERYGGERARRTQRLKFPRCGLMTLDGEEIAADVIPRELKAAEFELAEVLLGASAPVASALDQFEELGLPGGFKIKPRKSASSSSTELPAHVAQLINEFILSGATILRA